MWFLWVRCDLFFTIINHNQFLTGEINRGTSPSIHRHAVFLRHLFLSAVSQVVFCRRLFIRPHAYALLVMALLHYACPLFATWRFVETKGPFVFHIRVFKRSITHTRLNTILGFLSGSRGSSFGWFSQVFVRLRYHVTAPDDCCMLGTATRPERHLFIFRKPHQHVTAQFNPDWSPKSSNSRRRPCQLATHQVIISSMVSCGGFMLSTLVDAISVPSNH